MTTYTDNPTSSDIQAILDAAAKPRIETIDLRELLYQKMPLLITPKGFVVQKLDDLERHLPNPQRKRGTVHFHDPMSFAAYVGEQATEATRLFLNADYAKGNLSYTAIFNDHEPEGDTSTMPGWRDFLATYTPVQTEEWKRWFMLNRQKMTQIDFASFIEDNVADIATVDGMPTGAEILEMATKFQLTNEKFFKSATHLQSGCIDIEYIDREDSATRGRMSMFRQFALGIRPYLGGAAYQVHVRLKYQLRDHKLALWYEMERPERTIKAAGDEITQAIIAGTSLPILLGNPGV